MHAVSHVVFSNKTEYAAQDVACSQQFFLLKMKQMPQRHATFGRFFSLLVSSRQQMLNILRSPSSSFSSLERFIPFAHRLQGFIGFAVSSYRPLFLRRG